MITSATKALKFSTNFSSVNSTLPMLQCTIPDLSVRYWTCPDFAFLTAFATSFETVPTLGLGIKPFGPRIWPNLLTTFMVSGVAITTSKSKSPFFAISARSSIPTLSAPASRAFLASSPSQKTATFTVFPVPFGKTIEPLMFWSDFFASTPKLMLTSIDSTNLTEDLDFKILIASRSWYIFSLSISL